MNRAFIAIAAAAGTVIVSMFWGRFLGSVRSQAAVPAKAFVADPKDDKRVVVRGWTDAELRAILQDFSKVYELPASFASVVRTTGSENVLVAFPNDLPSDLFFFLVNYLHYPERYELGGRRIEVVGKVTLTPAFDIPDPSLLGSKVRIYVPEGDKDFDVVYIAVSSGVAYENSFTKSKWVKVEDPRMPRWVHEL